MKKISRIVSDGIMSEMISKLLGTDDRFDIAEENVSTHDTAVRTNHSETEGKNCNKTTKKSIRKLWGNFKWPNICMIKEPAQAQWCFIT